MKVVAFNGSPRKNGNTYILLNSVLKVIEEEGIETELVQIGGKPIQGCIACYKCFERKNKKCAIENDCVNDCIAKMIDADGMLLGSPTYVSDLTANLKALIERAALVSVANGGMFRRKIGAGVVAVRRAGAVHVLSSINYFFLISQMIVPGSTYWNLGVGLAPGDVNGDEEGMKNMRNLGENIAWLLKKIQEK